MKNLLMNALAHEKILRLASSLGGRYATIFVGHRFANWERDTPGHDPAILRQHLEFLRRNKFNLLSLTELIRHLRSGTPLPSRTVVFTIDDGYDDFAQVAAPIFEAYDCPVTVFLTTGFIDREVWMWWDQISHVVLQTDHQALELEVGSLVLRERWTSTAQRTAAAERVAEALKQVLDREKWAAIGTLADALGVLIPREPPPEYAPMTWEEIRTCEKGVTAFGVHSVTHPILRQVDSTLARYEIAGSWDRLRESVATPVPVFCYPNGTEDAFSERDAIIAREAGLEAAVTTVPRYVRSSEYRDRLSSAFFRVPRFGYPEPGDVQWNDRNFRHIVGGVERGRAWWRRIISRVTTTTSAGSQPTG